MCLKELCYCLREPIVDGDGLKHTKSRREDNREEARSKPKLPKTTDMPNGEFRDSNGKFTPYTPPKEESPRRAARYFAEEESSVGPYPQPQRPKKEVHSRIHGNVSEDGFPSEFETADIIDNRMLKKVGPTDVDSHGNAMAKSQAKTNDAYAGRVESMQAKNEVKYPF